MAIKISKDGLITKIHPINKNNKFTKNEMTKLLGENLEYDKFNNFLWYFYNKDIKHTQDNLNIIATKFGIENIYGDAIFLSPIQIIETMFDECDIDDIEYTFDYEANFVDTGFVTTLVKIITEFDVLKSADESFIINYANLLIGFVGDIIKEPKLYKQEKDYKQNIRNERVAYIPNMDISEFDEEAGEQIKDFLRGACDNIITKNKLPYDHLLMYEGVNEESFNNISIVVDDYNDKLITLEQIINILIEDEDYDNAAKIRDIKKYIEINNN